MEYVYNFDDGDDSEDHDIEVRVMQDPEGKMAAGVGSTVWDCALVMCKYLEHQRMTSSQEKISAWNGWRPDAWKSVLELGAGTGIVGLVVASMLPNSSVCLTDQKMVMPLLESNVKNSAAKASVTTQMLDWTQLSTESQQNYDLILVSDCVVWPNLFQALVDALMLYSQSTTEILLCYERRDFDSEVPFFRMFGEKFFFNAVPATEFHPDWRSAEDIYLFRCRLR